MLWDIANEKKAFTPSIPWAADEFDRISLAVAFRRSPAGFRIRVRADSISRNAGWMADARSTVASRLPLR